ncbi:TPA: hypothetical protein U0S31_003761 [Escherichia coli]|nr:hypothetical protein [Escherichia coli]
MNIRNLCLFSPVSSGLNILILSALVSFPLPSLALTGPSYYIPDADMIFRGDVSGRLTCNYFYLSGGYAYCPAGTVLSGTATLSYIPGSNAWSATYIYSGPVTMWKADESDYVNWEKLMEGGYCVSGDKISFTNGQFSSSVGDGTTAVLHATSFSATIQGTEVNFPSEGRSKITSTDLSNYYDVNVNDGKYSYYVKYGLCEYVVADSDSNLRFSDAVFNLDSGYLINLGPDYQRSDVINKINYNTEVYESEYYTKYLSGDSGDSGTTEGDSGDSGTTEGDSGDSGTTEGDSGDSGTTEGDSGDSGTTGGDSGDSGTTGGDSGTTGGDSGITDEDSGSSGGSSSGGGSSGGGSSGGSSSGGGSSGGGSSGGGSSGGGSSGGSSSGGSSGGSSSGGGSGDSGTTDGDAGTTGGDSGTTGGDSDDSGDSGSVLPPDDSGGDDSGGSAVVTPDDPVTDPPDSSEGSSGSEGSSSSGGSSSGDSSDSGSSGDSAGSGSSSGSGSASGSGSDSATSGGSGDSDEDGDGILAWLKKIYNAVVALPESLLPDEDSASSALEAFDTAVADDSSSETQETQETEESVFGSDSDGDGYGDGFLEYIPGKGSEVRDSDSWISVDFDELLKVNTGTAIPLQFTFRFYIPGIGDVSLVIDTTTFTSAYDVYIRPVVEYALYLFTMLRVISVVRRALFSRETAS